MKTTNPEKMSEILGRELSACRVELVDRDMIRAGDTIIHDRKALTLPSWAIKRGELMGRSIYGDAYTRRWSRVLYPRWIKGEIVAYVPQI